MSYLFIQFCERKIFETICLSRNLKLNHRQERLVGLLGGCRWRICWVLDFSKKVMEVSRFLKIFYQRVLIFESNFRFWFINHYQIFRSLCCLVVELLSNFTLEFLKRCEITVINGVKVQNSKNSLQKLWCYQFLGVIFVFDSLSSFTF